MALRKCDNCGKLVDLTLPVCPICKHHKRSRPTFVYLSLMCLGIMLSVMIWSSRTPAGMNERQGVVSQHSNPSPLALGNVEGALFQTTASPLPSPLPTPIGKQWDYRIETDKMGKGVTYSASVQSSNIVEFDFPYQGPQRATLILREHPRYGKDVILYIERGQILCRSYSPCSVLVRFDDEKAVSYSGIGPEDGSSNGVFLRGYSRFFEKVLKAKRVRLSVTVYKQGSPVFDFDISGFSPDKYKAKNG